MADGEVKKGDRVQSLTDPSKKGRVVDVAGTSVQVQIDGDTGYSPAGNWWHVTKLKKLDAVSTMADQNARQACDKCGFVFKDMSGSAVGELIPCPNCKKLTRKG